MAEWAVNGWIQSAKRAHIWTFPQSAPSGKISMPRTLMYIFTCIHVIMHITNTQLTSHESIGDPLPLSNRLSWSPTKRAKRKAQDDINDNIRNGVCLEDLVLRGMHDLLRQVLPT